ncbi:MULTISPECIES: DMT family transporter [unclassified Polynucleobacter]|jgi:drug/metabolite transporter (DMT)-like permease|uniref:DMT family transporter n=1 Tax=unclassified Polynucleobacter TaxID=2640945 RepID=UPI001BFE9206|nr:MULTISPECIES: DMT family transporter [unclassified Polynucleobacter]MBU3549412.1 DMT family transporter [Polynucleobacter sp. P1-05-14]MBU3638869.1 DMT family transporter [Polynucleobacter sp. AP-RePozz3-80-G7]MEA9601788.1 DMT family transporter [Polynucleobacter sp. MG-28-Ekke-A2]QWD82223.1 DMT family transporter [Polynucleobacter sp. MWH-S4W17]
MYQLNFATIAYLLIATALWAGNAIAGRVLVGSISPITLSAVRWGLAALLLLPLGWRVLMPGSALWQNKKRFLLLGLFGVGSYNVLLYLALQTSTAINVTLIGASMPIWMLFIGAVFYQVKPSILQMIGAVVSLLGVGIVLTRGDLAALLSMQLVVGDLLIMLATILWAFYSWMLSRPGSSSERQWPWAEFLMAQVTVGLLWTGFFDGFEIAAGHAFLDLNWWTASLIVFVAIGPSLIAYRCWGLGVNGAGPTVAAFFANFIPLFTALLSAAILGEPPQLFHGLAFGLIVAGIVISSKKEK